MPRRLGELEKACALYARLMEEIKRRHAALDAIMTNPQGMPRMAAFEFCYLQLRKICEVFALACLPAHGDMPEVRNKIVQKTYNADQIMKKLSTIHPKFYPVPGDKKVDLVTKKPVEVVPVTEDYLTKGELLKQYGE